MDYEERALEALAATCEEASYPVRVAAAEAILEHIRRKEALAKLEPGEYIGMSDINKALGV